MHLTKEKYLKMRFAGEHLNPYWLQAANSQGAAAEGIPLQGTLLAQNPSFDIGAGHRGVSRNAKIHNLTRNNPNLKEVEAAKQMLGGVRLPTF